MAICRLALEDGSVWDGLSFGAEGEKSGEVVFNTSMTGYQEILTDPSYKGQIVVMTYPEIGNYGVNQEDVESDRSWVEGFVAREFSKITSNWRAQESLDQYLKRHNIVAIEEIDTRAITRRLRMNGSMNGVISTIDLDDASLIRKTKNVPRMVGLDLVQCVTRSRKCHWSDLIKFPNSKPLNYRVALIDCGVKFNIIRLLLDSSCDVTIYPANVEASEIIREGFDGVCLSNGPGDPSVVHYTIKTVRELMKKEIPIFGICLGHQITGAAMGAKIFKLKFGHHGVNHPVKNLKTGMVEITSQNHGFSVEESSARDLGFEVTHINLNDNTVEGMSHTRYPVFSVQYHPEASPGPHDSRYLFDLFCKALK